MVLVEVAVAKVVVLVEVVVAKVVVLDEVVVIALSLLCSKSNIVVFIFLNKFLSSEICLTCSASAFLSSEFSCFNVVISFSCYRSGPQQNVGVRY